MDLRFKEWYRKYGTRKMTDFVTPKLINLDNIFYPRNTIIHFYNMDSNIFPTTNISYLRNIKKGIVTNLVDYNKPVFDVKKKTVSETTFNNNLKRRFTDFKIVPPSKLNKQIENNHSLIRKYNIIYNYSFINQFYRYKNLYLDEYYKFRNIGNTIFSNIININNMNFKPSEQPNHFVIMNLPSTFYSRQILLKYIHQKWTNRQLLNLFFDYNRLNILELFKAIIKEFKIETKYDLIRKKRDLDSVNILFVLEDKGIIINLGILFSMLKTYPELDYNTKVEPDKMFKLLHYMLHAMYVLPGFTVDEIETGKHEEKIKDILNIKEKTNLSNIVDNEDNSKVYLVEEIDDNTVIDDEKEIDKIIEKDEETELDIDEEIKTIPKYKHIKEMLTTDDNPATDVDKTLEAIAKDMDLDNKKLTKIKKQFEEVLNTPSPFGDENTIKDLLEISEHEIEIKSEEKKLPNVKVAFDKKMLEDPITTIDKKYIKHVYKKDITRTVFSLQRAGMLVKDYKVEKEDSILGEYEIHEITFTDIKKGTHKVKLKLPTINEDGVYSMSGNRYLLRKSRQDLPIKKIAFNRVSLSSAYGKLFIDKAPLKKYDIGFSIKKQLTKMLDNNKIRNLVLGNEIPPDLKLPIEYTWFMRYIKSFRLNNIFFNFDYENREKIVIEKGLKLEDIEKDGYVICGTIDNDILVIDKDNVLYRYKNKKYIKIGKLIDVVGLDKKKLTRDYSMVKIYKNYTPVVFMLMFYLGLDNMFKILNIDYVKYEGNKQNKDENTIVFKTKFSTYFVKPKNEKEMMLLKGLTHWKKECKSYPDNVFNDKDLMLSFFRDLKIPLNVITEIELLDNLFIDPVTANTLKQMKEPTTFTGLLLRANELLADDNYIHPQSLKGYVIKGYERIPQMVYNKMVEAIRNKKNEEFFGRNRLVFDPYSVWRILNEDSASVLEDDLNPIIYLKQKEDVTYTGFLGRKKESMSKSTRELHPDDVGVISEGHKDSGDVGISAYLSANPIIKNLRGMKGEEKELSFSNILSTSALLAPFSTTDDSKRLTLASLVGNN